jgi:hypothetical protein
MVKPVRPATVPTRALLVLYALAIISRGGSTYRGLAYALGIKSERALHRQVACAQNLGLVRVIRTRGGRGIKATIFIDEAGWILLQTLRH